MSSSPLESSRDVNAQDAMSRYRYLRLEMLQSLRSDLVQLADAQFNEVIHLLTNATEVAQRDGSDWKTAHFLSQAKSAFQIVIDQGSRPEAISLEDFDFALSEFASEHADARIAPHLSKCEKGR